MDDYLNIRGFKKLMNLVLVGTYDNFTRFLRNYHIVISDEILNKIKEAEQTLIRDFIKQKELETEENEINLEDNPAGTLLYTYLSADIESACKENGIDIALKPPSWVKKKIRLKKFLITESLETAFKKTLYEFEKIHLSFEADPTGETQLYNLNEDILNLENRDTIFGDRPEMERS